MYATPQKSKKLKKCFTIILSVLSKKHQEFWR